MERVNLSILVTALIIGGCGSVETSSSILDSIEEESNVILKNERGEILEAINLARSIGRDCHDDKGFREPVKPLSWNDELYASAHEHSLDMAKSNTFSHYGSGEETDITAIDSGKSRSYFYERITNNGYEEYSTLGENIAGGQSSLDEVMKAWLKSPTHCANIMNGDYSEIGVAVVVEEDSEYGTYWTQSFGSR
jgi:uncharacterized protein YkwD